MRKFQKKIFISLLFVVAVVIVLIFIMHKDTIVEPYATFYKEVEEKLVLSAQIGEDRITYTKKGEDATFETVNPLSPTLQEFLLLHDVDVKRETSATEIFSLALDIVFYAIFFGIIFVAFRKFISPNTFKVVKKTGKTFRDVIGMDGLKKDMVQIMDIMKNPSLYAAHGIRMPKGILLEGAPGNGKTLFAKALAGEARVNFIPTKATDFESMFMAIGPLKVKLLFKKARRKAPCIVFIDEFDGIGTRRNYSGSAIETENTRIVTALLNELDGFEPTERVLVIAATNSIAALDEALIRPGRFDKKVSVPYPNETDRLNLIALYTKDKKLNPDCTPSYIEKLLKGSSASRIESVLNTAAMIAAAREGKDAFINQNDIENALKSV